MSNAIRQGSGAPSGYPFTSHQDAIDAGSLVDVSITLREPNDGPLAIVAASLSLRYIHIIEMSTNRTIFEGSDPDILHQNNLWYLQWQDDNTVVCATFTADGLDYITNTGGGVRPLQLVDRAVSVMDKVVEHLIVETPQGEYVFDANKVRIRGGYNTVITNGADSVADINVTPGLGAGRYSNCGDVSHVVREIGGAKPDQTGNINFTGDNCVRVVPELLPTDSGYLLQYARFVVSDICEACCKCEDKVAVWEVMRNIQDVLIDLVKRYHYLRKLYNERIAKIKDGSDCSTRPLLNMDHIMDINGAVNLYVAICNGTPERLEDVTIHVSPLNVANVERRVYAEVDKDFFKQNKGIIEIPDDDKHFYSLSEAIRDARHMNLEADCGRGWVYTTGGRNHIKFPGGVSVAVVPFNYNGYRIKADHETKGIEFSGDGGIRFSMHCLEPGDTRYFHAKIQFRAVDEPGNENGSNTIFDHKTTALICFSPTHPQLNVVAKTGTGGGVACTDSVYNPEE